MSPRSELARRAATLRALAVALRADLGLLAQRERTLQVLLENPETDKSIRVSLQRVRTHRRQTQAYLRTVRATLETLDVKLARPIEEIA